MNVKPGPSLRQRERREHRTYGAQKKKEKVFREMEWIQTEVKLSHAWRSDAVTKLKKLQM